jgi:hypothetical protein
MENVRERLMSRAVPEFAKCEFQKILKLRQEKGRLS